MGSAIARSMEALADAMFPPGGPSPADRLPGANEVGAARRGLELLRRLPTPLRWSIALELGALEHLPRLVRGRPFSRLPIADRQAILARLERLHGPLADAAGALRLLPLLAYLGSPEVMAGIGYEPGQLIPLSGPLPPAAKLPVRTHPDLQPGLSEVFDVVIVGSGAGGAPVARALARAGWSVAVVEEGDAFTRRDFSGPELDRMLRLYRDGGATFTVGRPVIAMPVGKAVGGTTVVNSGTCLRTPDRIVASWRTRFGVELSPDDLGPHYEEVERTLGVGPVPWEVMGNNGLAVRRGTEALGLAGRPIDRNASGCHGSGVCAAGGPVDGKQGVHLNFLPQAVAAGAEILARCRVERVLTNDSRAVGVRGMLLSEAGTPAGRFTLHARRGVVVAAGAPFTPGLLARSGLRARSLGRNLRIHPDTAVLGMFDEDVMGWRGVLQSYQVDALADRGILLEATFPPPSLAYGGAWIPLAPFDRKTLLARTRNLVVLGLLVSDTSSGRVVAVGSGRTPLMLYGLNRPDAARVVEGMLLAARILFAAGAKEVYPLLDGVGALRSAAEAEACLSRPWEPGALKLSAYHPMGTARMGGEAGGVVDDAGFVWGTKGLAVSDASVFPSSLAVNPQLTIMSFASRAADRILASW